MNIAELITSGFKKLETLLETKSGLEAKIAELTGVKVGLEQKIAKLEGDATSGSTALAASELNLSAKEAKLKEVESKLVEKDARIKQLESEAKTTGERAAGLLASQNIPVDKLPKVDSEASAAGDLAGMQRRMFAEQDPAKRAELARECRKLRGHDGLFDAVAIDRNGRTKPIDFN